MMRVLRSKWRSGRRRTASLAVAGALMLVLASVAGATAGGKVVVKTPFYPIFAASGYGSIWVGSHHGHVLYRINPKTNRIAKWVNIKHTPCAEPAVGFGAIFVPDCVDEGGNTVELSARTNKVVRVLSGGWPVVGYGSVWTINLAGTVVKRLDPQSGITLASVGTGLSEYTGSPSIGTAGGGAIWLGSPDTKTVLRIDAATNKVVAVIPLPGAATEAAPNQGYAGGGPMVFAGGKVWYGNPAGSMRSIPPRTPRRC